MLDKIWCSSKSFQIYYCEIGLIKKLNSFHLLIKLILIIFFFATVFMKNTVAGHLRRAMRRVSPLLPAKSDWSFNHCETGRYLLPWPQRPWEGRGGCCTVEIEARDSLSSRSPRDLQGTLPPGPPRALVAQWRKAKSRMAWPPCVGPSRIGGCLSFSPSREFIAREKATPTPAIPSLQAGQLECGQCVVLVACASGWTGDGYCGDSSCSG